MTRAATQEERWDHDRDLRKHESPGRVAAPPPREAFDNFIHLGVDIASAGQEMIEQIGVLKAIRRHRDYVPHPRDMLDLRKALSKAIRSLESYDAIAKSGPDPSTREEYQAARLAVVEVV